MAYITRQRLKEITFQSFLLTLMVINFASKQGFFEFRNSIN